MKKQVNKFKKAMIIPIILGLVLLILFKNADSILEQLMIGFIFLMNLVPFVLHLISMMLSGALSVPKSERVAETIIVKKDEEIKSKKSIKPTYNAKTNNNVLYIDTRSRLIDVVKNGDLDRDSIMRFKLELDNRLGMNRYAYKDFEYSNDMHEIYIKLKSSKLKDDDYVYLKGLIEDLVGWFLYVHLYFN